MANVIPEASFLLDTNSVLGFDYQAYVANVRALALSKPDEYFKLRREVLEAVRRDAVKTLYQTLFYVLSRGTKPDGNKVAPGTLLGDPLYIPNYPPQKINDFCIEVASDLGDHINRAIDIILPDDFEKLAAGKLNLKGRANTIDIA